MQMISRKKWHAGFFVVTMSTKISSTKIMATKIRVILIIIPRMTDKIKNDD